MGSQCAEPKVMNAIVPVKCWDWHPDSFPLAVWIRRVRVERSRCLADNFTAVTNFLVVKHKQPC